MDHLRHLKYKNNQFKNKILDLENNFKSIKIGFGQIWKKRTNKEEKIYKKHLAWSVLLYSWAYKKPVDQVKDKIINLFKSKDCSKPECVKTVYLGGRKQSEENIIKNIRNLFKLKKEAIKDRTTRDIRTLFEKQEEKDYYKLIE